MKLTAEQTTYIENYIKKNDIKYYEVYMEILDHMILSVEDILENDKEISFQDAVMKAKVEGFGRKKGFSGLVLEKQKLAQKKVRDINFRQIKEYFTFPKITLTLSVFILYYLFISFFENPAKPNMIAIAIVGFVAIFQLFYSRKYRKINKLYVLKTQTLNSSYLLALAGTQVTQAYTILGKESIDFNHVLMRLFMTLVFTFSLISLLVFIEIRKKTVEELKTQIFV
ncbi:hypothetical protein FLGE108171_03155 [Flavobacterium gelidilacus]|uniref:hypothetical protein n=1 Tax=Flavobacterium gelidilacus TaxID=206041 RepID=UPI00047AA8B8|nr:hypothetical protein [Flavobacterium gelidilacus]